MSTTQAAPAHVPAQQTRYVVRRRSAVGCVLIAEASLAARLTQPGPSTGYRWHTGGSGAGPALHMQPVVGSVGSTSSQVEFPVQLPTQVVRCLTTAALQLLSSGGAGRRVELAVGSASSPRVCETSVASATRPAATHRLMTIPEISPTVTFKRHRPSPCVLYLSQ